MYGRQFGRGSYGGDYLRTADAPVTVGILAASVMTFVIGFVFMRDPLSGLMYQYLSFATPFFPAHFWTLLTWPIVTPQNLLGLLFGGAFFWWVGTSLERAWGTRNFALFMAATAALTGVTLYLGSLVLGAPALLMGLYHATAPPLVAWAVLNRRENISIYGVLPVPAPVLAWGTVALMWFDISLMGHHPLLGAFSLSGCALAYWYVTKGRAAMGGFARFRADAAPRNTSVFTASTHTKTGRDADASSSAGWNPITRWQEARKKREQDKRLEDMFRRSGYDDDKPRK